MAGKDLFQADDHDNLANSCDLKKIYEWTDATKRNKLHAVKDADARELISKILCKDPAQRPRFDEILEDDFFQVDGKGVKQALKILGKGLDEVKEGQKRIEKGIIELKNLAKETLDQVRRSEEVLRKAVFESTEILTPTCFVILPHKLDDHISENAERENAEMQQHLQGIAEEALCFTEGDGGGEDEEGGEEEGGLQESQKGSSKSAIGRAQRKLILVKKKMDKWLDSKIYDKPVYLYLVDELTGMPMDGDSDQPTYPIVIRTPKEKLRELVPLMCLGITAMSLVSHGGGLARMFGIPVPKLSSAAQGSMRAFANKMSKANSAEQFDCLQASIGDAKQSDSTAVTKEIRGKALREFVNFLHEHDPDKNFAGLRRVMTECGTVVWTSDSNVDPVSLSTQVAAISEEKKAISEEKKALENMVEQLERQLQEAQQTSKGNLLPLARVLPLPLPTTQKYQMAIQLEQKSGWLYKKGGMMSAAYQKRFFVLQNGVLAWYSSEQTSEKTKQQNGWISCCGLVIETDAGENHKGHACFTAKALSGSTTRRIELACDTTRERSEWVLALKQLQPVQLPAPQVLFGRVLVQVRLHAGAPPRSLALQRLTRTA